MWLEYLQGIAMGLLAMVCIVAISAVLVAKQMQADAEARAKIPKKVKHHMGDMIGRRNSK